MPSVTSVYADFLSLSKADQGTILSSLFALSPITTHSINDFLTEERFSGGRVCVCCGSTHIVRNGHTKNGIQRYRCCDCGKTFVVTTNSIASGTRRSLDTWEKYIDCMMNGLSVRKSADICGIHRNTAFVWRHKILDALQNMAQAVNLDGIVEADETFFAVSYKGNHSKGTFKLPRTARKRGHSVHTRGLSKEQACVTCAVNREGLSIAKVSNLGKPSIKALRSVLDQRIRPGSVLCTDQLRSYSKISQENGLNHVVLKSCKDKKGIYNIQHINNYHSQLKDFMQPFNGVSTKYLNNYLIWHNFVNYAKGTPTDKRRTFLSFVLSTQMAETWKNVGLRPAIPV